MENAIVEQQAMLQERGLVLVGQEAQEEEVGEEEQENRTKAIVSQETAHILAGLGQYRNYMSSVFILNNCLGAICFKGFSSNG